MGQKSARPATFDHLRKKQPFERVVPIPLNAEAVQAFKDASDALAKVEMAKGDTTSAASAYETARQALQAETVDMRFRAIGRKAYDALVLQHPPGEDQKAKHPEMTYDLESFSVALIAASCVEPAMTVDEVLELAENWNVGEYMQLWMAALEVNTQRRVVDLGKAWNGTHS